MDTNKVQSYCGCISNSWPSNSITIVGGSDPCCSAIAYPNLVYSPSIGVGDSCHDYHFEKSYDEIIEEIREATTLTIASKVKSKTPEEEKEELEEKRKKEEERRVKESRKKYTPEKIYYNNPVTVVFWEDGTKTTVRLHEGEEYNEYSAFCAALAKKIFGNNSHLTKVVKSGIKPKKKSKKATEQH